MRDNGEAMWQLGFYLGFLAFEIARRDWKNVILILTVGLLNGLGWSLLQNWKWAARLWPGADFNFWRSWETSGGISIGIAYGIAYYLVNRRMSDQETEAQELGRTRGFPGLPGLLAYVIAVAILGWMAKEVLPVWSACGIVLVGAAFGIAYYLTIQSRTRGEAVRATTGLSAEDPNLERWGAYAGLLLGLGLSIKNGLKGWANIYLGNEVYWNGVFASYASVLILLGGVGVGAWILFRPRPSGSQGDVFPHAYGLLWLVLIVQNVIAQLITGPPTAWNEVVFNIYYVLLLLITAVIVYHYRFMKVHDAAFGDS